MTLIRTSCVLALTSLLSLPAAAASLMFRADMHGQTVAASGVHVAGNFQAAAGFAADWDPATTALTDPDGDQIYEATVQVPAGRYFYKFVNGDTWAGAETVSADCGINDGSGNVNRVAYLGTGPMRLPATPFGGCLTQVRLAVNMQGQTVGAAGVQVAGNFQALAGYGADWNPATTPLADPDGDGIWETQLSLPAPGLFQYKFVNGAAWSGGEAVPAACGLPAGTNNYNRVLDATSALNVAPLLCFNACTPCGGASPVATTHWWNDAVFYEIFVRSFFDTNGDGKGDFAGLTQKLDYLNDGNPATTSDLGVTGLWLMPIMSSPSYHGYDITDYKAVESDYGTMADFEAFLTAAHQRGIRVILDMVYNHTSSQHPWFQQAAASTTSAKRDWFIWSPTNPGTIGPWGQTVWHRRNNAGQYYYGVFWSEMPDLNWRNAQVKSALWDASRFWLQKGVDGYRLDAIKHLVEDFPNGLENSPATFPLLHELHDTLTAARPDVFTVGEAAAPAALAAQYVKNERLSTVFEFDLAASIIGALNNGNATALRQQLDLVNNVYPALQYATFLTNHDQNRVIDQLNGNLDRMKQAAALYLTMPGVPFLYYGEEVGLKGSGADEDKRRPMQWTAGPRAGFTTGNPWRTINGNYPQFNVATMDGDPNSLLNHYRKLIGLRNNWEVLRKGVHASVTTAAGTTNALAAYARIFQQEAVVVAANVSSAAVASPALTLAASALPAGTYYATDLYSGQPAGAVTVGASGDFSAWTPARGSLGANQTWVLRLSTQPTGLTPAAAATATTLRLFPNPATGTVQVEQPQATTADVAELTVRDLTGRVLHAATFAGRATQLDTRAWANGVYLVELRAANRATAVQRLVVAH